MKKLFVFTLVTCVALSMAAFAQYGSNPPSDHSNKSVQGTAQKIKGTVKTEGDKTTLVADQDQKEWTVENPEALKGQEGQHVQVTAHVNPDKGTIHVADVKMLGSSKAGDQTK